MNFYPFHIGDYASATRHLSWDEDCAYRRLLDVYYTTEKPLPKSVEACFSIAGAHRSQERKAVRLVLSEFFTLAEDGWHNSRCDKVIARYHAAKREAAAFWRALPASVKTEMAKARRKALADACPAWLSEDEHAEIEAIYIEARQRSAETGVPHQVDHIVPLRGKTICGLHVPWNLQVLTASANRAKGRALQ